MCWNCRLWLSPWCCRWFWWRLVWVFICSASDTSMDCWQMLFLGKGNYTTPQKVSSDSHFPFWPCQRDTITVATLVYQILRWHFIQPDVIGGFHNWSVSLHQVVSDQWLDSGFIVYMWTQQLKSDCLSDPQAKCTQITNKKKVSDI